MKAPPSNSRHLISPGLGNPVSRVGEAMLNRPSVTRERHE